VCWRFEGGAHTPIHDYIYIYIVQSPLPWIHHHRHHRHRHRHLHRHLHAVVSPPPRVRLNPPLVHAMACVYKHNIPACAENKAHKKWSKTHALLTSCCDPGGRRRRRRRRRGEWWRSQPPRAYNTVFRVASPPPHTATTPVAPHTASAVAVWRNVSSTSCNILLLLLF